MNHTVKSLSALLTDAGKSAGFTFSGNDMKITGITDDTRNVTTGNIFICVKGNSFDGHTAAEEMLEKGAAVVVCDHDLGLRDRQIIVEDTRRFYGLLTAAWFGHPERELILVGITGTNGKTTMATMIHHILTYAGAKAGLIGTAGTFAGNEPLERDESTPTTPKVFELYSIFRTMIEKQCKYCVMEVSSFALEQNRIGPAIYTCGVFTNLTQDHLDYHKTMENYFLAKKKLFTDHCKLAFVNTEDKYGERLYGEISCPKFSYGVKGGTSVFASNCKFADGVLRFWFNIPGKSFPFSLKMMGGYNIANATAAIAVCTKLNVPFNMIQSAVANFPGVRGRCEMIPTHRNFIIVCDYAHSPDALENMLPGIKENTAGRLICLFGCGGDRDRTKRPLMAQAAAKYADYLIITSDNPRNEDPDAIIDEIISGLDKNSSVPYDRITDRRRAIFHAVKMARKGDVIVLAGKGHEDYQILAGNIHIHFDEREICAEALRALDDHGPSDSISTSLSSGMSIDELCEATGGRKENIPTSLRMINSGSISSDTRTITPGCTFIAFKGENHDAHDFVEEAINKGAVAAITTRPIKDLPCIVVEDTNKAIMQIAAHYRNKFTPKLVGITGSVGKTTTKEMTALALSSKYNTLKTEGNHNNEIGMPFTLLRLSPEHKAAVIEMGMSHFGEIERLSKVCRPSIAVITNIGWSHVENLGSREGILKAKLEILKGCTPDAPLIINGDDDMLFPLTKAGSTRRIISCGIKNPECDYTAADIVRGGDCVSFTAMYKNEPAAKINLPIIGDHHILDALIALAAAKEAGCDYDKIAYKLAQFKPEGLRQHVEKRGEQTVVIDCYNAAPASMKAALDVLCDTASNGKRVAVLGDMLELGDMSVKLHEEVGRYAAEKKLDLLVCYGNYAQFIAKAASEGGIEAISFTNKDEIINFLRFKLGNEDSILFKASRGMHMEEIIDAYYSTK